METVTENITNLTSVNITQGKISACYVVYIVCMCLCVLMGIGSVLGNAMVIYVIKRKKCVGNFRYINEVVMNLAITDALFGLIGVPFTMVFWHWGKFKV
jgi:hypothetical protein